MGLGPNVRCSVMALAWALALALALALGGCIPLPMPGDKSRDFDRLDERAAAALQPGVSRRDEVLKLLGEPNRRALDETWWAYAERHNRGHWTVVSGGPYVAGVLFETADRVDYRYLFVYFERGGLVRDLLDETGQCPQRVGALPCEGLYFGKLPDERLLESRFKAQAEAGEVVSATVVRTAWTSAGTWVPGAVVVSTHGLTLFETPVDGPVFRWSARIRRDQIAAMVEVPADAPTGPLPAVRLTLTDGSSRTIAFGDLEAALSPEREDAERNRARQFVKIVSTARP